MLGLLERVGLLALEVFDLLLLECDSLQVHELGLQQLQDWLGRLRLPHLVQHLEQEEQALYLEEELELIEVLEDERQVA